MISSDSAWQKNKTKIFWAEIAPCEHVLHLYEDDDEFLGLLTNFVGDGINSNEGVIVIATDDHLNDLKLRLTSHGMNVGALISSNRFFPLNAEETLSEFMRDGWPDEELFMKVISNLIKNAKRGNNKVRAFGEMVAVLWSEGNNGATVNLEHLWNKFCEQEAFCLFCAYPKSGFTQNSAESMLHICDSHSRMIKGDHYSKDEIFHKLIQSA